MEDVQFYAIHVVLLLIFAQLHWELPEKLLWFSCTVMPTFHIAA